MHTASTTHTNPTGHTSSSDGSLLVAWRVRLEISSAIDKLLPCYRSLGDIPHCLPTFMHPVWGTVSHTICFLADRMLPGSVNARLPAVADPVQVSGIVSSHETSTTAVAA